MSKRIAIPLLLTILHHQLYLQSASAESSFSSLFNGPDFKIEARVGFQKRYDVQVVEETELTEYYSPRRQKARLEFRALTYKHQVQYFLDFNQHFLVRHAIDQHELSCKPANQDAMTREIFGEFLSEQKQLRASVWLAQRPRVPNYVIGPSRLLAIINSQGTEDKLVFDSANQVVRNHESVRYKLIDDVSNQTFYVYYCKTDTFWGNVAVPLRVVVILEDGLKLVVDFSMLKLLNQFPINNTKYLDALSYPVGHSCSIYLKQENLFNFNEDQPKAFSFKAELLEAGKDEPKVSYFVAYDGFIGSMRMDLSQESVDITKPIKSRTYSDLISNRKYNVRELDDHCVASKIVAEEDELEAKNYMKKILPFDALANVGYSEVRGLKTEVFEHLTETPPVHLFSPVLLNNSQSQLQSIIRLEPYILARGGKIRRLYTVVYYFSTETVEDQSQLRFKGTPLGPLMRIEIYEKKLLNYVIEVFEFSWNLAQAPNGDSPNLLFPLPETCVETSRHKHGQIFLELGYDSLDIANQFSARSAFLELLDHSSGRDLALRRALIQGSKRTITSSKINQLHSDIKQTSSGKLIVTLTGRLIEPTMKHLEAVSVGPGLAARDEKSIRVTNFEQCFWHAAHSYSIEQYLLFTYCYGYCTIDMIPDYDIEKSTGKIIYENSSIFILSGDIHSPCHLMRLVERNPLDVFHNLMDSSFLLEVFRNLEGELLDIPVVNQNGPSPRPILRIKRLQVDNNEWSIEKGETQIARQRNVDDGPFNGVDLPLFESKRINMDNDYRMSLDQCRTSCLKDMRCKSYSLCIIGFYTSYCRISDLNFRNSNVQSQILSGSKSKTALVTVANDDEELGKENSEKKVELPFNKRCRIYNKNALDLFGYPSPVKRVLSIENKNILTVNSKNECAERCLDQNIKYFNSQTIVLTHENLKAFSDEPKVSILCTSFDYIDVKKLSEPVKSEFMSQLDSQDRSGICLLTKYDKVHDLFIEGFDLILEKYEISYSLLYERQQDYKLNKLRTVVIPGQSGSKHNNSIEFVNDQDVQLGISVEACARICFWRNTQSRTSCRSFDFVQGASASSSYCLLNTLSLAEAQSSSYKSELIDEIADKSMYSHYEPLFKPGLVLEERLSWRDQHISTRFKQNFGLLVICCLSIFSGGILTILYFYQFEAKLKPRLNEVFNSSFPRQRL